MPDPGDESALRELIGDPAGFVRGLWDPASFVDRAELPSSGEVHRSLNPAFDAETYDAERAERYARREGFS